MSARTPETLADAFRANLTAGGAGANFLDQRRETAKVITKPNKGTQNKQIGVRVAAIHRRIKETFHICNFGGDTKITDTYEGIKVATEYNNESAMELGNRIIPIETSSKKR